MGIDIHIHIEYRADMEKRDGPFVHFATASLPRDSVLFYLIAGVAFDPNRMAGIEPLFVPKGLPADISFETKDAYGLRVDDAAAQVVDTLYVTRAEAEELVREGRSRWLDAQNTWLESPVFFGASWLPVEDLVELQRRYSEVLTAPSWGYQFPDLQIPPDTTLLVRDTQWWHEDKPGSWCYVERGQRTPRGQHPLLNAIIAAMQALDCTTPGRSRLVFWFDR